MAGFYPIVGLAGIVDSRAVFHVPSGIVKNDYSK
jgi:hypothetical protein